MVLLRTGVKKATPVYNDVPPVDAEYQFIDPTLAVALSSSEPLSHIEDSLIDVMVGTGFIVAVMAVLVGVVHPLYVASV